MNNDVEYILRVILRARDEMAAVLVKAREQLRGFSTDSRKMQGDIDNLNRSITSLNTRLNNSTTKINDWRAAMRGSTGDSDGSAKSIGNVIKANDDLIQTHTRAIRSTQDVRAEMNELIETRKRLSTEYRSAGTLDKDTYIKSLEDINRAIGRLSNKTDIGSSLYVELQRAARETQALKQKFVTDDQEFNKRIATLRAEREADADKEVAGQKNRSTLMSSIFDALVKDHDRQTKAMDAVDKQYAADSDRRIKERASAEAARASTEATAGVQGQKNRASLLSQIFDAVAKDHERQTKLMDSIDKQYAADSDRRLKDRSAAEGERHGEILRNNAAEADTAKSLDNLNTRYKAFLSNTNGLNRATTISSSNLRSLARDHETLARSTNISAEASDLLTHRATLLNSAIESGRGTRTRFSADNDRISRTMRSAGSDITKTGGALDRFGRSSGGAGQSVASLDNNLRGLGLLIVFGFAQQLITAMTALGGELVAVAGSAAEAGAALGGAFVAGIAEAIPAVGLLVGAMSRVKAVIDAVQQAQKVQQAQSVAGSKADRTGADAADAITNAHDSLRDATERVTKAQEDLTKARANGRRELQDLILAEKQAELAAKGAALSQKDAQEQLRLAVQTGASGIDVQQAQLGVQSARLNTQSANRDLSRQRADTGRAVAGGVEGLPDVKNAKDQLRDAEQAATRASRAMESAKRNAAETVAGTDTAAANLQYLLSQLSPAETRLYTAAQDIYKTYQRIFQGTGTGGSGIYGIIVDSFTRAVDRADKIIQMPSVISTLTSLARTIASSLNHIVDAFTTDKAIGQIERITEAGRKNLGPLTDLFIKLGRAFLNIAEDAGPSLGTLIDFFGELADKFLDLTSNSDKMKKFFDDGEKQFEAWVKLILSIIGLFAALTGAGGADTGLKSLGDARKAIDDLTKKVDDNRDKVAKFFEDARKATGTIIGVVATLGKAIIQVFDPSHIQHMADIINKVVIPAFAIIIQTVGKATDILSSLASLPFVSEISKWGLVLVGLAFASTSAAKGAELIATRVKGLAGELKKARDLTERGVGSIKRFGDQMAVQGKLAQMSGESTTVFSRALIVLRLNMIAALGPFGLIALAAVAVVAGIVLLLNHFGKLDDVVRGAKAAFKLFIDAIQPAIDSLKKALADLGINIGSTKDAMKVLSDIGKVLADIITVVLVVGLKIFASILAVVVSEAIYVVVGALKVLKGIFDVIVGVFDLFSGRGSDRLVKGLKEIGSGILTYFTALPHAILDVLSSVLPKGLTTVFSNAFKAIPRIVRGALGGLADLGGWILDKIVSGIRLELRGLAKIGTWIWNGIRSAVRGAGDLASGIASWLWDKFTGFLRREINGFTKIGRWIWQTLSDGIHNIGNDLETLGARIITAIIKGLTTVANVGEDVVRGFNKFINDLIPNKLGPIPLPDNPLHPYAAGGPVAGNGNRDSVRAALTPGEHVITRGEVAAAGGHGVIFAIRRMLGGGGQARGNAFADGGAVGGAASLTISFDGGSLDDFKDQWGDFWDDLQTLTRRGANYIEDQFSDMRQNTSRSTDRMYRDIRGSVADIQNSFKVRGAAMVDNWSDAWLKISKAAYNGLFYIGHETNRSLHALSADTIDFGLSAPSAEKRASGGVIGKLGQRGKDVVPALLGRGEAVLNWAHQKYVEPAMQFYYGHGLGDMFGRVRGYHAGGAEQPGYAGGGFTGPGHSGAGFTPVWNMAKNKFGMTYFTGYDGHSYLSSSGLVSDHSVHRALDMGNGNLTSGEDALNAFFKTKVPQVVKQLIWRSVDQFKGYEIGDHEDHVHLAMPDKYAFNGPLMAKILSRAMRGLSISDLLSSAGTDDVGAAIADHVDRVDVKGPEGSKLRKGMQKLMDQVRKVANSFLDDKAGTLGGGDAGSEKIMAVGSATGKSIFDFFTSHGFTAAQAAGWVGNLVAESGLNPAIVQPNGEGHGLVQWGGGRFAALQQFAKAHGNPWQDLSTQLAFIIHELNGPESAAYAAIKAAKTIDQAVDAIGIKYERYGIRGSRNQPAHDAFDSYAHAARGGYPAGIPQFADGGVVPGGEGTPRHILAHAGEWILNKVQQARLASLTGLSSTALASMLGFHGSDAKGYAGGGVLDVGDSLTQGMADTLRKLFKNITIDAVKGRNSDDAFQHLKDKLTDAYKTVIFDVGTNDGQAAQLGKNLKRAYGELGKDQNLILSTVRGPAAAAKNAVLRDFASSHDRVTLVNSANVAPGQSAADNIHLTPAGYAARAKRLADAAKNAGDGASNLGKVFDVLAKSMKDMAADLHLPTIDGLRDNVKAVNDMLGAVSRRIDTFKRPDRQAGITKFLTAVESLTSDTGLFARLRTAIERRATLAAIALTNTRFSATPGGVVTERTTGVAQAEGDLGEARRQYGDLTGERDAIATTLHDTRLQQRRAGLTTPQRERLAAQAIKLQQQLDDAQGRVADSITSIFEAQGAVLQATIDEVTNRADQSSALLDFKRRVATALGQTDLVNSYNQQQIGILQQEHDELTQRIASIPQNSELYTTVSNQIQDLQTQIVEAAAQGVKDMVDQVNASATRRTGQLDLADRLLNATGVVGQAIGGAAGISRQGIFQQRGANLQAQAGGLQYLLGQAANQGNVGLVQDLTDQLAELSVAIRENIKAAFQARVDDVNNQSGFALNINDLNKQIVDLTGQISGNTDTAGLLKLAQDRQAILLQKGNDLQALYNEAVATGDQQSMNDLQQAILENQVAVLQNTQSINTLNGTMVNPQGFSSSAWTLFREAIFNGMGQVLPQYDIGNLAANAANQSGVFNTTGATTTGTESVVNEGDIITNVYEAGGPVDTTEIAAAVGFARTLG